MSGKRRSSISYNCIHCGTSCRNAKAKTTHQRQCSKNSKHNVKKRKTADDDDQRTCGARVSARQQDINNQRRLQQYKNDFSERNNALLSELFGGPVSQPMETRQQRITHDDAGQAAFASKPKEADHDDDTDSCSEDDDGRTHAYCQNNDDSDSTQDSRKPPAVMERDLSLDCGGDIDEENDSEYELEEAVSTFRDDLQQDLSDEQHVNDQQRIEIGIDTSLPEIRIASDALLLKLHDYRQQQQNDLLPDSSSPVVNFSKSEEFALGVTNILEKYNTPLSAYEDLRQLINKRMSGYNFKDSIPNPLPSRTSLISTMSRKLYMDGCRPIVQKLKLRGSGIVIDMVTFDIVDCLLSLLMDENIVNENTLLLDPTDPLKLVPSDPITVYADFNTGSIFRNAHAHYSKFKPGHSLSCPLNGFGDKTHIDNHGNFTLEAFTICLSLCNYETRFKPEANRILFYIPNLSSKHAGLDTSVKMVDKQHIIEFGLRGLKAIQTNTDMGLWWDLKLSGKVHRVLLHFSINLVAGDSEGLDGYCGRYIGGRGKTKTICRSCLVKTSQVQKPVQFPKSRYTTKQMIQNLVRNGDRNRLHELSYHFVRNAFYGVKFSDDERSIHGATPPELLHLWQQGLMEYLHASFFGSKKQQKDGKKGSRGTSKTTKQSRNKSKSIQEKQSVVYTPKNEDNDTTKFGIFSKSQTVIIDTFSRLVGRHLQHQSDRDLPRCHFQSGISSTAKKNAHEQEGVLLGILLAMLSGISWQWMDQMETDEHGNPIQYNAWIELLEQVLMMNSLYRMRKIPTYFTTYLQNFMPAFLAFFARVVNRTTGMGMTFLKFHLSLHTPNDIERHGSPENYSGGPGETRHKNMSKKPGKRAQKRIETFDAQAANRYYENSVLSRAHAMVNTSSVDRRHSRISGIATEQEESVIDEQRLKELLKNSDDDDEKQNVAALSESGVRGRRYYLNEHGTIYELQNKKKVPTSWHEDETFVAVRDFILEHVYPIIADTEDRDFVTMYTEYKDPTSDVLYRAHPNYAGSSGPCSWHDWSLVTFPPADQSPIAAPTPCRLLIFVEVPKLIDDVTCRGAADGADCFISRDGGMYAICQTTTACPFGKREHAMEMVEHDGNIEEWYDKETHEFEEGKRTGRYAYDVSLLVGNARVYTNKSYDPKRRGEEVPLLSTVQVHILGDPIAAWPRSVSVDALGGYDKLSALQKKQLSEELDRFEYQFLLPRTHWPSRMLYLMKCHWIKSTNQPLLNETGGVMPRTNSESQTEELDGTSEDSTSEEEDREENGVSEGDKNDSGEDDSDEDNLGDENNEGSDDETTNSDESIEEDKLDSEESDKDSE